MVNKRRVRTLLSWINELAMFLNDDEITKIALVLSNASKRMIKEQECN